MCVAKNESLKCVGHIPYEIAHCCSTFLENGKITATVTGKRRLNRDSPTGGLEIPCMLTFEGQTEEVRKLELDIRQKRMPPDNWK